MQLNFSLKRAWDDFFTNPKYKWQLFAIAVAFIFLKLSGSVFMAKGPKFLASIIMGGYTSLLSYNIINSKEKVLENIFNNPETEKFILLVGLKAALIDAIYLLIFVIPATFVILFLFTTGLRNELLTSIAIFTLIPIIFYIAIFPTLVFSQNLSFKDAFNFKLAFSTLKKAWKDYIICFLIILAIILGLFGFQFLLFSIYVLIQYKALTLHYILSYFSHVDLSYISNKLPQNIVFYGIGTVIAKYLGTHILAQVYKSTLTNDENFN